MKNLSKIALNLAIALLLISCGTKLVPVKETFHRSDTTIITEKSVPVFIEGSQVAINIDSLFEAWTMMLDKPQAKIVYVKDKTNSTQLKIFYDSIKQAFVARCETLEREASVQVEQRERRISLLQETIVQQEAKFGERLRNGILQVLGGVGALILLAGIILIVLRLLPTATAKRTT